MGRKKIGRTTFKLKNKKQKLKVIFSRTPTKDNISQYIQYMQLEWVTDIFTSSDIKYNTELYSLNNHIIDHPNDNIPSYKALQKVNRLINLICTNNKNPAINIQYDRNINKNYMALILIHLMVSRFKYPVLKSAEMVNTKINPSFTEHQIQWIQYLDTNISNSSCMIL